RRVPVSGPDHFTVTPAQAKDTGGALTSAERGPIDMHVHLVGNGTGQTGCWLRVTGWHRALAGVMLRHIGLPGNALTGDFDRLYADRLLDLVRRSSLQ